MKRVHLLLLTVIFVSIAAKVAVTPAEIDYPAVSSEFKEEKANRFFEYKVDFNQSSSNTKPKKCDLRPRACCRV